MDELIVHKSWWKRNRKWFVPLVGVLFVFVISIASSPIVGRISDVAKAYLDPNLMRTAILKAQANEDVVGLFGSLEPVSGLDMMRGIVNYSNNDMTIDIYVHVKGSKGKGRMRVFADWNNDKWIYNNISVVGENVEEPIVVVEKTVNN
ncbi:hypothetical protein FEE95_07745 [Maribacter algarum]|uniref:Cytochrome oxidase complex assembly protein 1 n=1 Tax=Maribacter algarum (ex Zhang et al. 2020) TaxID=2578118 RepID=A0A5S3PWE9_9FLAO|nr:cytochrome c oxidase assembly factor Coa1 family protein [Maribacter algarum]TMM59315.1 hypothetical protein FEE95_07745 [Maribacter algarum]